MSPVTLPVPTGPILIIEPVAAEANWLRRMLGDEGPRTVVATLAEALVRLREGPEPVILLDIDLPDARGVEAWRRVHHASPDSPVVLLTTPATETLAQQAMVAGAQDYLVFGQFERELLLRTLHYAIDRVELERRLAACRPADPITGLLPPRHFAAEAAAAFRLAWRADAELCLGVFELGDHPAIPQGGEDASGDALFRALADILRLTFRRTDILGRIDTTRLGAVARGSTGLGIVSIRNRLEALVRKFNAERLLSAPILVQAGFASRRARELRGLDDLVRLASRQRELLPREMASVGPVTSGEPAR